MKDERTTGCLGAGAGGATAGHARQEIEEKTGKSLKLRGLERIALVH